MSEGQQRGDRGWRRVSEGQVAGDEGSEVIEASSVGSHRPQFYSRGRWSHGRALRLDLCDLI